MENSLEETKGIFVNFAEKGQTIKSQFHGVGTLCKADWNNRDIVDACVYSLLKKEYEKG